MEKTSNFKKKSQKTSNIYEFREFLKKLRIELEIPEENESNNSQKKSKITNSSEFNEKREKDLLESNIPIVERDKKTETEIYIPMVNPYKRIKK